VFEIGKTEMILSKILKLKEKKGKHVIVVDRYCMCKRNGESRDHLLLFCEVVSALDE
jgi:hypothetical protein